MTGLHKSEVKSANLMAGTWTKAAKVRRAFKAGRQRQKDLLLTPERAMFEGYILLREIQTAMRDAGLPEADVQTVLVLMTTDTSGADLIYAAPIPETKQLPVLYRKLKKLEKEGQWIPLGIVVQQLDREEKDPKSKGAVWVEPWLTGPRAVRALIAARGAVSDNREGKSTFS
jgi:hypothetical protein